MEGAVKKYKKEDLFDDVMECCNFEILAEIFNNACNNGNTELVEYILNCGKFDVSYLNIDDACIGGYFNITSLLLKNNEQYMYDPSGSYFGALVYASDNGYLEIIKLLIGYGVKYDGNTELFIHYNGEYKCQPILDIQKTWKWDHTNYKYYPVRLQKKIFVMLCIFNRLNKTINAQISKDIKIFLVKHIINK